MIPSMRNSAISSARKPRASGDDPAVAGGNAETFK